MFIRALGNKGQIRKPEQDKNIRKEAKYNIICYRARTNAIKHRHMKYSPKISKTEIHRNYYFITNRTGTT